MCCRYDLLDHQRPGFHGITNFAVATGEVTCGAGGMHDHALKFFADLTAFERIEALRAVPAVAPCMTVVKETFSEAASGEDEGPTAEPLVPPCVVSMHLESLEDRVTRRPPDASEAVAQLAGLLFNSVLFKVVFFLLLKTTIQKLDPELFVELVTSTPVFVRGSELLLKRFQVCE